MKKIITGIACMIAAFLFSVQTAEAQHIPNFRQENIESPTCSQEAEDLYARLDVIQEMDKSTLPREEKRALRQEVKTIQQKLQEMGNGVYISAGALIVILILLIILI